jgi:hypothetical protein
MRDAVRKGRERQDPDSVPVLLFLLCWLVGKGHPYKLQRTELSELKGQQTGNGRIL